MHNGNRNGHRLDGGAHRPMLTIRDLAERLRCYPSRLYRAARVGEIPGFKVRGGWRFSGDVIEKWVLDKMCLQTALIEEPGPWLMDSRRRRARHPGMNTKGRKSKVS